MLCPTCNKITIGKDIKGKRAYTKCGKSADGFQVIKIIKKYSYLENILCGDKGDCNV